MLRHILLLALLLGGPLLQSPGSAAETVTGEPPLTSLTIAVSKYWNGPEKDAIRKASGGHPVVLSYEAKNLEAILGVPAEGIGSAALVGMDGDLVIVGRTDKPFDPEKIVAKLLPDLAETKTVQGHLWAGNKKQLVVCLADRRTFLLAREASARRLAQVPLARWTDERLSALGDVATSKTFLVIQVSPALLQDLAKSEDVRWESYRPLALAESLRAEMVVDRGLHVTLRAGFADPQAAERAIPAIQKVLSGVRDYFDMARTRMPEFLKTQTGKYPEAAALADAFASAIHAAQSGIEEAKVLRGGKEIEATILVKTDHPVSTALLLLSLAPRPAAKP
jgi:hypothetical protein